MDFSYIFRSAKLIPENLENEGFTKTAGLVSSERVEGSKVQSYTLRRRICGGDFYAVVSMNPIEESLAVQVYDSATDEKYALFENPRSHGSFVSSLRAEVQNIIEEIRAACFACADLKEKYIAFLKERFGAEPEFLWKSAPSFCIFRCENQKWFAAVMNVKYSALGLRGDEEVWIVDIKADSEKIPSLIDKKSVFPAWHMNKKHWITVLLTAATDFDRLCELTERSFELVN